MRGRRSKLLALALVIAMCMSMTTTAYAYPGSTRSSGSSSSSWWSSWWNSLWGSSSDTDDADDTADATEDTGSDATLTAVEDETTVEDSSALRASTYALTTASDDGISTVADEDSTTVKYFPVTMYDYDYSVINAAIQQAEVEETLASGTTLTQWNGLYFSSGNPENTTYVSQSYTYELDEEITTTAWVPVSLDDIDSGSTYVIVGYRGQALTGTTSSITGTATGTSAGAYIDKDSTVMSSATAWTITKTTSGYTIKATINNQTRYMTVSSTSGGSGSTSTSSTTLTIKDLGLGDNSVSIGNSNGNRWLNQYNYSDSNPDVNEYKSWTSDGTSDDGSRFYIYKLSAVTTSTGTVSSSSFAYWNYWTGNSLLTSNLGSTGNYLYSGIAASTLDSSGNIVLNAPGSDAIFNSDSSVKTIYTNVEMPFVYDSSTSMYTFDSAQYGVYFLETEDDTNSQGATTAQSNGRLYLNTTTPQYLNSTSETVWAPYDERTAVTSSGSDIMNYHFGLKATIPFTMTTSGKLSDADSDSKDIVFSFSGDDDVWIYIDGTLVADLGGITNKLNATINFAENTVTLDAIGNGYKTYTYNSIGDANTDNTNTDTDNLLDNGWEYTYDSESGEYVYTHALFNSSDSSNDGLISMTRATFAASSSHELSVFYLERGEGGSNCKIEFNLPVYDYVSVTKNITQSITSDGEISDLTDAEQAVIDNVSFGFTLYHDGEVVSGATYTILNVDGQAVGTGTTDASGHFTLTNGQTARFVTQFDSNDTWYVVEDEKTGYSTSPGWSYTSTGANAATETAAEDGLTSDKVHVVGGDESEDSIHFTCNNYLSVTIPNPGILTEDEEIVIDYGLSVEIDVLSNDLYRADEVTVIGIAAYDEDATYAPGNGDDNSETSSIGTVTTVTGNYGTATLNSDGTITYQLTSQMTGVEVLVYEVKLTGSETDAAGTTATKTVYGTGKVYIIPATIMYYEEDFGGLTTDDSGKVTSAGGFITFSTASANTSGWKVVGTAQTAAQEPGVVGTLTDSTYGSDVAYLSDGADSNGTSMYVNTTSGAAQFSYTFTGTGTTFFARTTNDSATIAVTVKDSDNNTVYQLVRDTSYKDYTTYTPSSTSTNYTALYNIPVFTWTTSDYGTYTVSVTVYKANSTLGWGSEFWLDGIRITNPLNEGDANAAIANSAYATDGESGMTYVTLRDKLLKEYTSVDDDNELIWTDGNSFVVFTDTDGTVETASTYQSDGPKEEVYLANGQSVTFSLANWDADSYDLYLGMKAPTGSGTVTIGSRSVNVNNATDCYYEISDYGTISTADDGTKAVTFTITATSDAIISLTNLKVTGNANFVIVAQGDDEVNGFTGSDETGDEPGTDEIVVDEAEAEETVEVVSEETEVTEEAAAVAEEEPEAETEDETDETAALPEETGTAAEEPVEETDEADESAQADVAVEDNGEEADE
ncbi:MAG: VCBS domain-containing protein [Clostridiales bacterium]|nr:VCBS domain-containing protein [Clostridiales bacterium]